MELLHHELIYGCENSDEIIKREWQEHTFKRTAKELHLANRFCKMEGNVACLLSLFFKSGILSFFFFCCLFVYSLVCVFSISYFRFLFVICVYVLFFFFCFSFFFFFFSLGLFFFLVLSLFVILPWSIFPIFSFLLIPT